MTLRQLHAINPRCLCSPRLLAWVEYYYDLPRTVTPAITGATRTADGFVMFSTEDDPFYNRMESAEDLARNLHGLLKALSPSNVKPGNAGIMNPDRVKVSAAMQRKLGLIRKPSALEAMGPGRNLSLVNTLVPLKPGGNSKLGPDAVGTTRPVGPTCPLTCQFHPSRDYADNRARARCYATMGPTGIQQTRAAGMDGETARARLLTHYANGIRLIRLNVAGDVVTQSGELDRDYLTALWDIAREMSDAQIWAYTHAWREFGPLDLAAVPPNVALLASVDTPEELETARDIGFTRFARVSYDESDRQPAEMLCPVDRAKYRGAKTAHTCQTCRLCWRPNASIVFLAQHLRRTA